MASPAAAASGSVVGVGLLPSDAPALLTMGFVAPGVALHESLIARCDVVVVPYRSRERAPQRTVLVRATRADR